jgi:CRISPR system Cascade subunit CasD
MKFLVFQLTAPLSAWGDVAVGEYRGSRDSPGESALIGLLGAALGVRREEGARHEALRQGYRFAVGLLARGELLRDYHTAQVPGRSDLKGRPHATRRDELALPKERLNTILSTRDYRQDGASVVAVQAQSGAPHTLEELASALRQPRFVLYLGRKCCPPGAPLAPAVRDCDSAHAALLAYLAARPGQALERMSWGEGTEAGVPAHFQVPRKDRVIRRSAWQFGDRLEHVALLGDAP